MRLKHFLSVFLTLLTLSVGQMWGASTTATFNWASNGTISATTGTIGSITLTNAQNSSSSAVTYDSSNGVIKLFPCRTGANAGNGGSITFTAASGSTITGIAITSSSSYNQSVSRYSTNGGTSFSSFSYSSGQASVSNLSTSSVIIKNGQNSGSNNKTLSIISVVITYTTSSPSYTITAQSNNTTYGTVSLSGSVITATPAANCRIASTAYTVTGSATVTRGTGADINKFTVTPAANCTVRINFEPIPTHKISFNTGGLVDIADATGIQEGAAYSITQTPAASLTNSCEYGTFVGWTTANSIADASVKPTIITSYQMGNSDVTLHAVYSKTVGGSSSDVTINFGYTNWGKSSSFSGNDYTSISQEVDGVSVTDVKNTGSLYANASTTRFYKANELTFAADDNITSIIFDVYNETYKTDITSDVGTCTATASEFSWEGSAKSVTFTRPSNADSYIQFSSATVTVGSGTTTYSLDANCCSPLGQINGSFF